MLSLDELVRTQAVSISHFSLLIFKCMLGKILEGMDHDGNVLKFASSTTNQNSGAAR